jgi:uncharacterized protein GlcG (DUF336 family)
LSGKINVKETMHTGKSLRLAEAGADAIMRAAVAKAREIGVSMSIAIVDEGTNLLRFTRTEGGKIHTIGIAMAKARAAASNRMPTAKVGSMGNELSDYAGIALTLAAGTERYATLPGGLPIIVDGHCVGGIGVSGGLGEQDVLVAQASLSALR